MPRSVPDLRISHLSPAQLRHDLGIRDLSDPAQGPHAIQIVLERAVESLSRAWDCEVRWCRGQRIVPVADNYDRLGYPAGAISRDARYTRYVDDERMLRSHSTAMAPPALRRLATDPADDVLLVCPGIVYRRDAIDWQHTGTPQQLDLWRITRRPMREADLDEMTAVLTGSLAAGLPVRQQPRTHPYTLAGRQVDVRHNGQWVEIAECGVAHPRVLAAAGLGGLAGLALGMGLDRLLMLAKDIPDIRLLRSADPRVAGQMLDLARYQRVSMMPPITRDLSVAVAAEEDEETIGDRIRDALGADARCVEEARVLSATSCDRLPESAIARLGARPGQQNLLIRVVLRDLDTTLTNKAANALRDRIYRALHEGTQHQWAGSDPDGGGAKMDKEEARERYEATADERYYEIARPLYEQALADSPADARLLVDWGFLQECHGRSSLRAAADCYRRAIDTDPSRDKAHYQLISALRALGDLDTVIARYEQMVASTPADPRGRRLLSMAYLRAGKHENAAAAIDAGLLIAPDDTLLTELRGDLYEATGRPDDALASWRRAFALAADDDGISMRFSAAFLLEHLGRITEAVGEWRFIVDWMSAHGETIHIDWPRSELRRLETQLGDCRG